MSVNYEKMTVPELKAELVKLNLSQKGKKAELIQRLMQGSNIEEGEGNEGENDLDNNEGGEKNENEEEKEEHVVETVASPKHVLSPPKQNIISSPIKEHIASPKKESSPRKEASPKKDASPTKTASPKKLEAPKINEEEEESSKTNQAGDTEENSESSNIVYNSKLNDVMASRDENKIFVGGLPLEATEDDLTACFTNYGEVKSCNIVRDKATNSSKGFAFLQMATKEGFDAAIVSKPTCLGRVLNVKEKSAKPSGDSSSSVSNKIFIGNLPHTMEKSVIFDFFNAKGTVTDVHLILKPEKENGSFGFVTFSNVESANQNAKLGFVDINGVNVQCKQADPPKPRNSFGGYGAYGVGGGGGYRSGGGGYGGGGYGGMPPASPGYRRGGYAPPAPIPRGGYGSYPSSGYDAYPAYDHGAYASRDYYNTASSASYSQPAYGGRGGASSYAPPPPTAAYPSSYTGSTSVSSAYPSFDQYSSQGAYKTASSAKSTPPTTSYSTPSTGYSSAGYGTTAVPTTAYSTTAPVTSAYPSSAYYPPSTTSAYPSSGYPSTSYGTAPVTEDGFTDTAHGGAYRGAVDARRQNRSRPY